MAGEQSVTRTYDRIFSIVKDEVAATLFDIVSSKTALLFRMKQMGAIKKVGGQPQLRFNVLKELPTTQGYTDLDTLTPVRSAPVSSVIYNWKQLACPVQVSGLDMIKTGEAAVTDLLTLFISSAAISMRDAIGGSTVGIFSDADVDTTGKITGLQNIFTTSTTTGTVGGLSRASLPSWRHNLQNVASAFDTYGLNYMRTLYRQCSRFDEVPDSIALNGSTWDNYLKEIGSTFSVNLPMVDATADKGLADAGFPNVKLFGAVVFADDGCPANRGYFLNLRKYHGLYVREGRDADLSDFVKSRDRDDLVSYVLWAGDQVNTNLARGGVLINCDTY